MSSATSATPTTFGEMLKYLRKRAYLTQRELGIAVGYSETHITRLENGARLPDPATVKSRFIEALSIQREPKLIQNLVNLAEQARRIGDTALMPSPDGPDAPAPTNIELPLVGLIGRQHEFQAVTELVQTHRLVTLVGAGGVGKTRLAMEVGIRLLGQFTHGVQMVELAPLADAALVTQTVAAVFKVTNQTGRAYIDTLRVLLAGKRLLLILDNCEHVIAECAQLVDALLRACPTLHILATSREALNIQGELAWRVPSMHIAESAQLFAEYAHIARNDFILSEQNEADVTAICTRLDGIPLAIELAASRLSGLSVKQLAARLDDRFNLLTNGSRAALARHQTLRALITWSYDLLSDQERALFRRLAVFAGGWTAEAAEGVGAAPPDRADSLATVDAPNVLPLLLNLVNKSLVVATDEDEHTRYHMLETIRQFAWEQLETAGETAMIQAQHAKYFLAYLQETAPAKMRETNAPISVDVNVMACTAWVTNLQPDRENLRAALTWSLQQGHDIDTGIQLALWQYPMWELSGPRNEARKWLELALSHTTTTALEAPYTYAQALMCLGSMVYAVGEERKAKNMYDEALSFFRRMEDPFWIMVALDRNIDPEQRDVDEMEADIRECLALARELEDPITIGLALSHLGGFYQDRRADLPEAINLYAQSLAVLPENEYGIRHIAKFYQAGALRKIGHPEGTLEQIQDALAYFRMSGFVMGTVGILEWLGRNSLAEEDYVQAQAYLYDGLTIGYRDGSRGFTDGCLEPFAELASAKHQFVQSVTLAAFNASLGWLPRNKSSHMLLNTAREQLDEHARAKAEAAGRAMSFDQAVAYVLAHSSDDTQA